MSKNKIEIAKGEEFTELTELLKNMTKNLGLSEMSAEESQMALADAAVLTSAEVIFFTRDNDKDGDTWLESWINLAGDREAAYGQTYGHFNDWSTFVLNLRPKTTVMHKSDIRGSWLQVRISPKGNDTWVFTCKCTPFFSDGTVYRKDFLNPTTLSQVSRQANFPL